MDSAKILRCARDVLDIEAKGILSLSDRLDENFVRAVDILSGCKGKVVVTGLGKSGLIGRKIAATFSSTGTPSLFLHATEGIHGDLGMIMKEDVVLAVSNSCETDDLLMLPPIINRLGPKITVRPGTPDSRRSRPGDVILNAAIKE